MIIDNKEVYVMNADLDDPPPEGLDAEAFNLFQITEVFRGALRRLDPTEKFRLDITKRPTLGSMP